MTNLEKEAENSSGSIENTTKKSIEDSLNVAKQVLQEVAQAKHLSTTTDIDTIFMSAETIIGLLAFLTGPIVESELAYRRLIVKFEDEGKSNASAEARAKASDEYMVWRKLDMVKELATEQLLLLKKFKEDLGKEWKRS